MKTIKGILLVSLLGFLGCGGNSDAGTAAVPGKANLVAPFGIIDTLDPIYEWTPVPGAIRYRLMVQDADDTVEVDEWYTAEESGCASDEVSCTVHPGIITTGENTWKVQACANQECGLWSEPLHYDMSPSPVSDFDRYENWGDGTVTDKATDLMWGGGSRCEASNWADAISCCENLTYAGHDDWFLPSLSMLSSLNYLVNCSNACGFSPYHPVFGRGIAFWTATGHDCNSYNYCYAYVVFFGACDYGFSWDFRIHPVRCVRYDTEI